jgi:c(7)-type cytochrome triheme protein
MPYKTGLLMRILVVIFLLLSAAEAMANYTLPPLPSREEYGNILINRTSTANDQLPVTFSHWQHRTKFTCRVCHGELDFLMKVNATEITERENRKGKFCGACHNGKIAFRHNGNCDKCHNGEIGYSNGKFEPFLLKNPLAMTVAGNGVNWSQGIARGVLKPQTYIKNKSQDMSFEKELLLEAEMSIIPPAIFPHKAHTAWLDCDNCHPDLFNIKKKGTHFSMAEILKGNYCGVCHMTVAFPMDECKRCHPAMRE